MGMGQWGAYGYALHGWTYDQILAHYYAGTTVGQDPPETVRVLLADARKRIALDSTAPWSVVDATGQTVQLPAGKLVLDSTLTVNGQALVPPLTVNPGTAPLLLGAAPYRGVFIVNLVNSKLQVVNRVGIEDYVMGVVPAEVPSTWPAAALEAQAVAARSYAVAGLTTIVTASNFDLYGDTRSQAYGGIKVETPATTAAVTATAGQVVLYDGQPATTYFSASTGGQTVSALEATGKAVPYLQSVTDPYDTYSPNHDWGPVLFDARAVAKAVGLQGPLVDLQTQAGSSRHVASVTAVGATSQVVLTGSGLRADLGLRSTWFTIGWLALTPPAPLDYGATVSLAGIDRGVAGVTLEAKPAGGVWTPLQPVAPDASGAFTATVTPAVTTSYRLTSGDLHAALVRLPVVPVVTAQTGAGAVAGTIQPAIEGAPVELQLQAGTAWTTVGTGTVDATGAYSIPLPAQVTAGSYRVRCAPGRGLSPGVSLPLVLP
jgi:SpoIID/LytB domain protein